MELLNTTKEIILASQSPRRKELLAGLGIDFKSWVKTVDESYPQDLPAAEVAEYLSNKKAAAYQAELGDDQLLITSDTVVVLEGEILEKPRDIADAKKMLRQMAGKMHTVYTGVTVCDAVRKLSFTDHTGVKFGELSEEEIAFYVEKYKPMDKAGAYGVQEWIGYVAVERMEGSFYTVMGLPVYRLYQVLKEW